MAVIVEEKRSVVPFLRWAGGKRWLIQSGFKIVPDEFSTNVKGETLTQAAFIDALIKHITTKGIIFDDIAHLRKKDSRFLKSAFPEQEGDAENLVLREFLKHYDQVELANLIIAYFNAVKSRWNKSWESEKPGVIIKKTNGFKAFMRFFPIAYKKCASKSGEMVTEETFRNYFNMLEVPAKTFTTDQAHPGQGGENHIYNALLKAAGVEDPKKLKFLSKKSKS